jgi:hypothetical protein
MWVTTVAHQYIIHRNSTRINLDACIPLGTRSATPKFRRLNDLQAVIKVVRDEEFRTIIDGLYIITEWIIWGAGMWVTTVTH